MLWCPVLDLHYAADQPAEILRDVVRRCYLPLVRLLDANPRAQVTVNLDSVLAERLQREGHAEVIEGLGRLMDQGQVEVTAGAARNAILTALEPKAILDAIETHEEALRRVLGPRYIPQGLFPPEMGYAPAVGRAAAGLGYRWVLADDSACVRLQPFMLQRCVHRVDDLGDLYVFLRDRNISTGLMYAGFSTPQEMIEAAQGPEKRDGYLVTATAAEVFGYHHEGYEQFLQAAFAAIETATVSSALQRYQARTCAVQLKQSSWSPWATLQY